MPGSGISALFFLQGSAGTSRLRFVFSFRLIHLPFRKRDVLCREIRNHFQGFRGFLFFYEKKDVVYETDRRDLLCKQSYDGKRKDGKMTFTKNMRRVRTNSTDGSCVPGRYGRGRLMPGVFVCLVLFLTGCDGSGGLGKSQNCTCPEPVVRLCEIPKENLTGGDLGSYSGDGDMDTVKYIIARFMDQIPLPQWHSALEAALGGGHLRIAEILIKEMAKLPEGYSTLSKRDWDGLMYCLVNSGHPGARACDAMRFVFKHAGNIIDNPLNLLYDMSDCQLQACIDFGYLKDHALQSLKEDRKGLIAAVYSGHCHYMHHRGAFDQVVVDGKTQFRMSKEKVLENRQMAAEAVTMVKRLLDNGYRPTPVDIASLKNEDTSEEEEAKDAKIKILKLLEKYK